ncbi:hypothetical protein GmHk_09G026121 [Glycine max]|nr:hypothetical protein GmHk_09G026121 [Glycine max]
MGLANSRANLPQWVTQEPMAGLSTLAHVPPLVLAAWGVSLLVLAAPSHISTILTIVDGGLDGNDYDNHDDFTRFHLYGENADAVLGGFSYWIIMYEGCLLFRISELHTKKETWKIAVCITDMWDVKKHNGRQAIDMVLMDQTGAKIGATLWQELFPEFQPKLHLEHQDCGQFEYKVSPIPFLVYFVKTTSVKEVERPEIPPNVHVITEIVDIIVGVAPRHTLVAKIIMTLWEDYAHQLDDAIEKNHFVRELLVVMLTLAKIKDAKGDCNCILHVTIILFANKYPLSIQNIKNGSKLYVNTDIAKIQKFRNSLHVSFYVDGVTDEVFLSPSIAIIHNETHWKSSCIMLRWST